MDDNMSIDGTLFLEQLTEKLKYRIEELDRSEERRVGKECRL